MGSKIGYSLELRHFSTLVRITFFTCHIHPFPCIREPWSNSLFLNESRNTVRIPLCFLQSAGKTEPNQPHRGYARTPREHKTTTMLPRGSNPITFEYSRHWVFPCLPYSVISGEQQEAFNGIITRLRGELLSADIEAVDSSVMSPKTNYPYWRLVSWSSLVERTLQIYTCVDIGVVR